MDKRKEQIEILRKRFDIYFNFFIEREHNTFLQYQRELFYEAYERNDLKSLRFFDRDINQFLRDSPGDESNKLKKMMADESGRNTFEKKKERS